MEKFNSYYPVVLMFSILVFYPINHLLGTLGIQTIKSMQLIAPVLLIGVVHMILAYKDFRELIFKRIPIFTFFVAASTVMLVSESYIFQTASYVPSDILQTYNIYWVVFTLSAMLFAFYLKYILNTLKSNLVVLFVVSSLWLVILIVFSSHFSLIEFLKRSFLSESSPIDFQTLCDYTVIGAFFIVARFFNNNLILLFVSVAILFEIFLIGSRSSILLFAVSIFLLLIRQGKLVFLLSVISIVLILLAIFFQDLVQYYADDYRVMTILGGNYGKDLSLQQRTHQLHNNLRYVEQTWFTGRIYGEYLLEGVGTYIHNYLSYLQNFGIIPFALLNLLFLKLFYNIVMFKNNSFGYRVIFILTLYTILSMLISRSYDSIWVLITLAMSESYFYMLSTGELDEDTIN